MNKCSRCGKKLKRAFFRNGKIFGPECVKLFVAETYGGKLFIGKATDNKMQLNLFEVEHVQS